MANGDKPIHVTRREFYAALSIVWVYIMLLLGFQMRTDERWSTTLLFFASVCVVIAYTLMNIRALRARLSAAPAVLSDRVKQLAGDPSQKIEAIKVYREETGASLADAKEAVEAFIQSQ